MSAHCQLLRLDSRKRVGAVDKFHGQSRSHGRYLLEYIGTRRSGRRAEGGRNPDKHPVTSIELASLRRFNEDCCRLADDADTLLFPS